MREEEIIDNAEKLTYEVLVEDNLSNWDEMSPNEKAIIMKDLSDLYNQEKEKNKVLTNLIFKLRNIVKYKVIIRENDYLRPCKNLTKQEVYESFLEINLLLKGNYAFLENREFLEMLFKE